MRQRHACASACSPFARLTHPFIRSNGELVPCSWDEAFAVASQHMQRISEQYGADANAVYGGGSLTNETAYLLGKFAGWHWEPDISIITAASVCLPRFCREQNLRD